MYYATSWLGRWKGEGITSGRNINGYQVIDLCKLEFLYYLLTNKFVNVTIFFIALNKKFFWNTVFKTYNSNFGTIMTV